MARPMHAGEFAIDEALVGRLVAERFPRWSGLPLSPVTSAGTDNALFRLGDELVVRLPRISSAALPVEKEHAWLPRLAPSLPLEIPEPVALGEPSADYPWRWSILRWIEGRTLTTDAVDGISLVTSLGAFVRALEAIDAAGGPPPGPHNSWRGEALERRDDEMRAALSACRALEGLDVDAMTAEWETALAVPGWDADPVWVHGDLLPTNVLERDGRPHAVLDFGCLGTGDPACDAMAGWTTIPASGRAMFRETLALDDATWARGRGWALSWAVIALPYYVETNPALAGIARRTISAVLDDADR